jgi:hypothetical protein
MKPASLSWSCQWTGHHPVVSIITVRHFCALSLLASPTTVVITSTSTTIVVLLLCLYCSTGSIILLLPPLWYYKLVPISLRAVDYSGVPVVSSYSYKYYRKYKSIFGHLMSICQYYQIHNFPVIILGSCTSRFGHVTMLMSSINYVIHNIFVTSNNWLQLLSSPRVLSTLPSNCRTTRP